MTTACPEAGKQKCEKKNKKKIYRGRTTAAAARVGFTDGAEGDTLGRRGREPPTAATAAIRQGGIRGEVTPKFSFFILFGHTIDYVWVWFPGWQADIRFENLEAYNVSVFPGTYTYILTLTSD